MRPGLVAFAIGLLLVGCGEAVNTSTITLPLSQVDDQAIPVTLPSGTGTIQVLSGQLVGSRFALGCTWTLNLSDGSNPTGSVADCAVTSVFDLRSLTLDLAGPPGPTGPHIYEFGLTGP